MLSTHEVEADQITMSPNPASDSFTINIISQIDKVQIFDSNGRIVKTQILPADNKVGIADLTNGIYIVKAYSGEEVDNFKIVKN